ncbi:hypothetical protein C8R45DRAFT_1080100 [Mycena sanguinolenta]|nr:hypothetical protein C8R45DRAFT_1080100 [Mycena sanguinolenta]
MSRCRCGFVQLVRKAGRMWKAERAIKKMQGFLLVGVGFEGGVSVKRPRRRHRLHTGGGAGAGASSNTTLCGLLHPTAERESVRVRAAVEFVQRACGVGGSCGGADGVTAGGNSSAEVYRRRATCSNALVAESPRVPHLSLCAITFPSAASSSRGYLICGWDGERGVERAHVDRMGVAFRIIDLELGCSRTGMRDRLSSIRDAPTSVCPLPRPHTSTRVAPSLAFFEPPIRCSKSALAHSRTTSPALPFARRICDFYHTPTPPLTDSGTNYATRASVAPEEGTSSRAIMKVVCGLSSMRMRRKQAMLLVTAGPAPRSARDSSYEEGKGMLLEKQYLERVDGSGGKDTGEISLDIVDSFTLVLVSHANCASNSEIFCGVESVAVQTSLPFTVVSKIIASRTGLWAVVMRGGYEYLLFMSVHNNRYFTGLTSSTITEDNRIQTQSNVGTPSGSLGPASDTVFTRGLG